MNDYKKIQKMIDEERKNGAFIFMPSPILSMENSFYMPVADTVLLREDEIYKATGHYRIHFNGLLRLAAAAGFEWSAIDTCRTDGRTDRRYCSFRAVGGVRKADGKVYFHKAEDDIDIDVIEDELIDQYNKKWETVKGCTGNQSWKKDGHKTKETFVDAMVRRDLIQKRKNKLKLVESGAKARVIRFVLGLQGQYKDKSALIGMPFIMISYTHNIGHPDVKKILLRELPASRNMIYGGVKDTGQIEYVDPDQNNPDVIDVPSQDESEPAEPEQSKFEPAEPEPDNGNLLDFQNSDIDNQILTLKAMCKTNDEDYQHYEKALKKKGSPEIRKIDQEWRSNFFTYLNEKEGDKK